MAAGVRLVITRLVLIFALPLEFHGRVRVVRSVKLPAALHGIEASLLASDSLRKLRSSIHRVVWSRRQPLASVGAVIGLLDGPTGCDPAFCVVWGRFRLLRRYLALWPMEIGRVYSFLEKVSEGGPIHLLSASADEMGALAWSRPGLPLLSNLAGSVQQFKAALLDAWRNKVPADLCGREGFVAGLCWIFMAPCSSLILIMFEKEIRLCFGVTVGVSGMGFSLVGLGCSLFHVDFVVRLMVMVTIWLNVPFLLWLRFVKVPSFMSALTWLASHAFWL